MTVTEQSLMTMSQDRAPQLTLTVKEYAAVERVDERTVRRWVMKRAVAFRRTPGGGIRIIVQTNA